ncbi:hypothetical protein ASD55_13375 [Rhodanobacter sp. Root561]|uniref:DUF3011 domain-containing protein n=1 Tax=Rhodanobacter sp. Root561 TaxID=1736560 RepID=UPI0006FAB7E1|nr:DUF3011 domain-containing protein [Rhodanobacter sp. Root561]KQZ71244.1 hypothetical protein ASD55_13375 [Rhodanobacter sp. Root561]
MRAISGWASGIVIAGLLGSLLGIAPPVRAQSDTPVRCVSKDGHYARCAVPWRRVELYKQESKGACIEGQSWGMDHGTLWVDRGCRGLFGPAGRGGYGDNRGDRRGHGHPHGGWQPGPDWNRRISLQCDSNKKKYQMCQVDVGRNGSVRLGRQLSDARCTEGYSWGWNRAGVWVAHGCRGQFLVDRRW